VDFGRDAALYRGSGQMCDSDVEVVKWRDSDCGSELRFVGLRFVGLSRSERLS
jgi:hypothetical protein